MGSLPSVRLLTTDRVDGAFVFHARLKKMSATGGARSRPMSAGAAGCWKEIPRSWNAKGIRRNMGGF